MKKTVPKKEVIDDHTEPKDRHGSTAEETCLPHSQAAVDANLIIKDAPSKNAEDDVMNSDSLILVVTPNETSTIIIKKDQTETQVRQSSTTEETFSPQSQPSIDANLVTSGQEDSMENNEQNEMGSSSEEQSKTATAELEVENHSSEVTNQGNSKTQRPVSKNYIKCSKCTLTRPFVSSKALQKHQTRCHAQVLNHTCHNCGHCFKHPVEKIKSIRTIYTQTDVDGWMCEICCMSLSSFDEIEKHKLVSHSGNSKQSSHNRFVCKFCAKTYQFQCQLNAHELVHTNTKAHKCPHCPKSFRLKGQLGTHVNIHTKQTIYSCGECGANFYQATVLHHHLRSKHQEWKYKCQFCQKGHVTKNDMLVHERIHTGEKPYVCEECGVGFPRKQNLNNHLKAHRNERSYACSECGKAFFRKSTLKEHLRTHTGEKPYQCQRCNKRFTQKSHLRAHLRSHLRQELQRHQPLNQNDTAIASNEKLNIEVVDGTANMVDIQPTGNNTNAVAETSVTGDGVVENVTDALVTDGSVVESATSDAELQNQNTQVAVSNTISDECVVLVQDDTSSDTQAVGERDGNLVIQVELS